MTARAPVRLRLRPQIAVVLGLALLATTPQAAPSPQLPSHLSDQEFWDLVIKASEPNGFYRSDNLASNELWFERVVPDLVARTEPGGVYLGVGPEQNFTYVAAMRPAIAIIFDIRRGNFLLQLMYKAIFELAKDRADFIAMLFSKKRPETTDAKATVDELFAEFAATPAEEGLSDDNLTAISNRLTGTHHLPLSVDDLRGIAYIHHTFYARGFAVMGWPTYAELMTQTDMDGVHRSFLASEDNYTVVKQLESKNLVVPIVGDFAGPKAIRAIGSYLKANDATVTAFYLSNVEQYLYRDHKWTPFCRNVASLPLDQSSTFIRATAEGGFGFAQPRFVLSLVPIIDDVKRCTE